MIFGAIFQEYLCDTVGKVFIREEVAAMQLLMVNPS
jgi:hypothetical protein